MSIKSLWNSTKEVFHSVWLVVKGSYKSLIKNPEIIAYPVLAVVFFAITYPLVDEFVFSVWNRISGNTLFTIVDGTPHYLKILLGLVTFSVFYTIVVSAFFTCAMSAGVTDQLEGRPTPPMYNLNKVLHRFGRVLLFAVLAIFLFPLGLIAQRHRIFKSPRAAYEVVGRSLSLNIAQLGPEILYGKEGLFGTIRVSINTLGRAWRENLVIKVGMYVALFLVTWIGFLPKLVEHFIGNSQVAHLVGWLTSIFVLAITYLAVKVLGGVFTVALYHHAKQKNT